MIGNIIMILFCSYDTRMVEIEFLNEGVFSLETVDSQHYILNRQHH